MAMSLMVAIALTIGLAVGLTVGRRRSSRAVNHEDKRRSTAPDPQDQHPFPIGKHAIITALHSVSSTDCTSDSDTWNCYPFLPQQHINS
jgi:hypothetical protein